MARIRTTNAVGWALFALGIGLLGLNAFAQLESIQLKVTAVASMVIGAWLASHEAASA